MTFFSRTMRFATFLLALSAVYGQSKDLVQEVPFDGTVTISCNSPDPTASVFWKIPPNYERLNMNSIMVFLNESKKFGDYRCYSQIEGYPPTLGRTVRLIRPITNINLDESLIVVQLGKPYNIICPHNFGVKNTNWLRFKKDAEQWITVRKAADSYLIPNVTSKELTAWRCESANGQPSADGYRSAAIVLTKGYYTEPNILVTPKSESTSELVLIKEGQEKFVMECVPIQGSSSDKINWEFKNQELKNQEKSLTDTIDNDGYVAVGRDSIENAEIKNSVEKTSLEINQCKTKNSGFYRCKLPDQSSRYAQLRVQQREPEIQRFGKSGFRQKQAKKAESVSLLCNIEKDGFSSSDLVWVFRPKGRDSSFDVEYRLGDPPKDGISVSLDDDRSRLQIDRAEALNEGRYFCKLGDVADYTDLSVGLEFEAKLSLKTTDSSHILICTVTRGAAVDPISKYKVSYFEVSNGDRKQVKNFRRLQRFDSKDRRYVCKATEISTEKFSESSPVEIKGITMTVTSETVNGFPSGANLTLRCEISDTTVKDNYIDLHHNGGRVSARRNVLRDGVVRFSIQGVNKRNSGDYQCVIRGSIKSNPIKIAVCSNSELLCRDMTMCYPKNKKCDGNRDCADGSDEDRNQCIDCEPNSLKCGRFRNVDPELKCVLKHWICDGQDDCGNGWDEYSENGYCSKHPLPIKNCVGCGRNETCCSDGKCFPRSFECDKEIDCTSDQIDELQCTCDEASQLELEAPLEEITRPVLKDETLELVCRVRGKERPTINWRFNWGHLPDEARFVESMSVEQVVPEGAQGAAEIYTVEGKLLIKSVNPKTDLGRYTCEAVTKCKRRLAPDYIVTLAPGLLVDCNRLCYNHTNRCDKTRCFNCQHNTEALRCDSCKLGFCGDATQGRPDVCLPCNCNGHSNTCSQRTCVCENCRDNTEGVNCERCKNGYEGNPLNGGVCRPKELLCNCSAGAKTVQSPCGQPCECKRFVTGTSCNTCLPGYFGLASHHADGCLPCYCNNKASLCESSGYYYVKTPMNPPENGHELFGRGLYGMNFIDVSSYKTRRSNSNYEVLNLASNEKRDDDESFLASTIFSGNMLRAYGGNIKYDIKIKRASGEEVYKRYPLFGLKGRRGKTLWYWSQKPIVTDNINNIIIPVTETNFVSSDNKTISRDDLMVVLKTLYQVFMRVQYFSVQSDSVIFSNYSIDLATNNQSTSGLTRATFVEKCQNCLSPYQDLFCDKCLPGNHEHVIYKRQYEREICLPCEAGYSKTPTKPQVSRVKRRIMSQECTSCEVGYTNFKRAYPPQCDKSLELEVKPEYYRAIQGRQLVLWCSATFSSHPVWLLNWERADGNPLPDKARVERNGNTTRLVIPDISETDAVLYRCTANNRWALVTAYSDINVIADGGIKRIDMAFAKENGQNVVKCNVTSNPGNNDGYRMVLGYNSILEKNQWQAIRRVNTESLKQQEHKSQESVDGLWQCHVTDMNDKYTVSKSLLIQEPLIGADFSLRVQPQIKEYRAGQRMVLKGIRVGGGNNVPVAWQFEKMTSSQNVNKLILPRFAYQDGDDLIVDPMSEEYAGTYYFRFKKSDGTFEDSNPVAKAVISVADFEPRRKMLANVNSRVSIPCFNTTGNLFTDGLKCDKYVWSHRTAADTGESWAAAARFTAGGPVQDENYVIPRVMANSHGIYTCRCYVLLAASSRISYSVISEIEVAVLTNLDVPPKIEVKADQNSVKSGMTVNVNCTTVKGLPIPDVSWSGQFGLNLNTLKDTTVTSGVGWSNLRIAEFDVRVHTGSYKCSGENRVGHVTKHANLYFEDANFKFAPSIGVQYYSDFKSIISGEPDIFRAQAGVPMEILCRGIGSPIPITQAFFTATTPVGDTPTSQEVELKDVQPKSRNKNSKFRDIASIRKESVRPADSGIYRCNSANSEGNAEKLIKVEVVPSDIETYIEVKWFDKEGQLVPVGQNRRPDVPVEEGEDVLVICRARYLNGTKIVAPKYSFMIDQSVHGRHKEMPLNAIVGPKTDSEDRSNQLKFKNVVKEMMEMTYACYVQDQSNFNSGLGYAMIRLQVKDSVTSPNVQIRRSASPQPIYDPANPEYANVNPQIILVNGGDSLDISCYMMRGSPSPVLELRKCQFTTNEDCKNPGDPIPHVEIYDDRTTRENRRFTRMRISSMKDEYNGKYQCLGQVPYTDYKINGATLTYLQATETVQIYQNRMPGSYASDASKLTVQINPQSKMLEVECFITGVPAPSVTVELPSAIQYSASQLPSEVLSVKPVSTEILQQGTRLILTVSLAQQDRSKGTYRCNGSNNQGMHRIQTEYQGA